MQNESNTPRESRNSKFKIPNSRNSENDSAQAKPLRGAKKLANSTKTEVIALLEGRTQVSLENIRQFILEMDEWDYMEFLYPSDPDFAEELEARNAEAKGMLETLRDIEGTLRGLDVGGHLKT
jgi:hypothetical protein